MKNSIDRQKYNDKIMKEWEKMTKGLQVDPEIVKSEIINDWRDSLKLNIDPYRVDDSIILTREEFLNLTDIKKMEKEYGDIINIITRILP